MGTPLRRPLPAFVALLALLLLTAFVWWRVLNRDNGSGSAANCPTPTPTAPAAVLPGPSKVTVRVLNSTHRNGIASRARGTLVSDGFQSPHEAANDKAKVKIRGVAEIRYGTSGQDGAKLLHYYFPGALLVRTKSKSPTVVVSLGRKFRKVAAPSAVEAALRHNDIQVDGAASQPTSSPTC